MGRVQSSFKILGIRFLTSGALRPQFFPELWELLGTKPLRENVRMSDDGLLILGTPPWHTKIRVPVSEKGKTEGSVAIWVDNLDAAAAHLASRDIAFKRSTRGYEGLDLDLTPRGELIEVRLDQAPPEEIYAYIGYFEELQQNMREATDRALKAVNVEIGTGSGRRPTRSGK